MSATKDHFAGYGWFRTGGRSDWIDASDRRPCPICHRGWCQIHRDGTTVLCKRVPSDRRKTNVDEVEFYVHHLDTPQAPVPTFRNEPSMVHSASRADVDSLHRTYSTLLCVCPLSAGHRESLSRRKLSEVAIRCGGYGSLPERGRAALAKKLVADIGEDLARGIPGLIVRSGTWGRYWSISGYPGILLPCRDPEGRIVALNVRRDGDGEGPRYSYLSSAKYGGPKALVSVHVPIGFEGPRDALRISEGVLKCDVATVLSGMLTVSAPGVGLWRKVMPLLAAIRPKIVRVAFDMDAHQKPEVSRALRDLVQTLYRARYRVAVETWPARHKGIDDYLAARAGKATDHE